MGEGIVKAAVAAVVLFVVWSILRPSYVFLVRIDGGRLRVQRGKAAAPFLAGAAAICADAAGWFGAVRKGRRIALVFSRHFSPACQQRLRNAWQFSR